MKKDNNSKLAKGILAAGGALSLVALKELLLSKEEHDKKEREINKLEKTKDKYLKRIGKYEPFDIEKGKVTQNDGKLVNLLTRAVGVAFTNDDVFVRNKSNIRTFPFIITDNNSVTASIEVELRKYYEVLMAAEVASLINNTVFATENILNINDNDKRTVNKILDKVLNQRGDLSDLGFDLQRGIYENVLVEQNGEVKFLLEANAFHDFDDYVSSFEQVIRNFTHSAGQKERLARDLEAIKTKRDTAIVIKRDIESRFMTNGEVDLVAGNTRQTLNPTERTIAETIEKIVRGDDALSFDGLEPIDVINNAMTVANTLARFTGTFEDGLDLRIVFISYLNNVKDYQQLLSRGLTIINNNNWVDPAGELVDSDPYYKLLGLPGVSDYSKSSELIMKMFKNSNTLKIKLEIAAALLISTEILPPEFIEYVTKFLGLPMNADTKRQIGIKYGLGDQNSPYVFMGNDYTIQSMNRKDVLRFMGEIRPNEIDQRESLLKKLTMKDLGKRVPSIFNVFRSRKGLEQRWRNKYDHVESSITQAIDSLYEVGHKLNKKELRQIIDKDKSKFGRLFSTSLFNRKNTLVNKMIDDQLDKYAESQEDLTRKVTGSARTSRDGMFSKSLSLMGAGGNRVHKIIEDRLKNKIVDMSSLEGIDKSLDYFLEPENRDNTYDPKSSFMPNLQQTQDLMKLMLNEGFEDELITTVLTEDVITDLTEKTLNESYVYQNITTPVRTVTYKEVEKDAIEYVLPNYTRGKSLLYGAAEIDSDQFRNRKVGEPIWIQVTFSDKINSMKVDNKDNDYTAIIGIKSEVHRVPEKDLMAVLKDPSRSVSGITNIFQAQKDQTLGLLSKIANENELKGASLNGILVASMNEATSAIATKPSENYVNNPKLATNLMKRYNLTSFCLVDPITEEYYMVEHNATGWSRMPFSELRTGSSSSDMKLLASMLGRGR